MQHGGQLWIDGRWRRGGGALFERRDPAHDQLLWSGHAADARDIEHALLAARRAQPDWADLPFARREGIARRYAELLERDRAELTDGIAAETGKPRWDAQTELQAMINKIDLSVRSYHERTGRRQAALGTGRQVVRHRAHGVVAVFGPYNFPGHLPNGHIVPALLAGNAVLFKPSELGPATAQAMTRRWEEAGLPPGVLNLLQGERETGRLIAAQEGLDGLFFTGSASTGALLARQFAERPGRLLALELGGNNPLVIGRLAEPRAALHDVLLSAYLSAGQRCTCARRLYVPDDAAGDAFVDQLVAAVQALRVGAWDAEPQPFMGPLVCASAAEAMLAAEQRLQALGGRVRVPLRRLPQGPAWLAPGLIDIDAVDDPPDEEYFGPLLQLRRYTTLDEAIERANATRYGLAAGLLSSDREEYERFRRRIRAGVINWNRPTTGASGAAPFGGCGASGNHRPSAWYAADYCAYPVASIEAEASELPATPTPGLTLPD